MLSLRLKLAKMKKIIICVDKVAKYEFCGSHRTSDGWVYKEKETISPLVWFSEPIVIDDSTANKLFDFLNQYISYDIDDEVWEGRRDSNSFEPNWTIQVAAVLNYALASGGLYFVACDNSDSFTRAFYLTRRTDYHNIAGFEGYAYPRRTLERLYSPESPFDDITKLKEGIIKMAETNNPIPDRWLAFLFLNSHEDLSYFLDEHSISIDNRDICICQKNGELLPPLLNVNKGIVEEYKKGKPNVSYEQACQKRMEAEIKWYQRYGADWQIESKYKQHYSPDYEGPEDYSYGKEETNSWEEGWEWNID